MKRIWQCDYCHHTDEHKEIISSHENYCSSNPKFKNCYSCKHHTWGPYYISGSEEICKANVSLVDMWDIQEDDDENCDKWENVYEKNKRNL
jgi:hypothetical protein